VFSPATPVSLTTKTDLHDITQVLLKVALHTITLNNLDQQKGYFTRKGSEKMHREIVDQKELNFVLIRKNRISKEHMPMKFHLVLKKLIRECITHCKEQTT
jgi:hypothetical protein